MLELSLGVISIVISYVFTSDLRVWFEMKDFKPSEFDSPDQLGSGLKMQASTLRMLQRARDIAGVPFTINSGYRTKKHNSSLKDSSPNSSHMGGWAVDIAVNKDNRAIILSALKQAGFKRIGYGATFIHVDNDPQKPVATWNYNK